MKLILASSSPHRAAILKDHKIAFTPHSPAVEEVIQPGTSVGDAATELSRQKCMAVCREQNIADRDDTLVLAADTIVVSSKGEMLRKPQNIEEASNYMEQRSGSYEDVVTGFCIRHKNGVVYGSEATRVSYKELPPAVKQEILASNEWHGVCGGLKVEGIIAPYVRAIDGDYDNIRGLPMNRILPLLKSLQ